MSPNKIQSLSELITRHAGSTAAHSVPLLSVDLIQSGTFVLAVLAATWLLVVGSLYHSTLHTD